jgi:hypothetical protein
VSALKRKWRLSTDVSTPPQEASSSVTVKTAALESTMEEMMRTQRGVAVALGYSGGLGGGSNIEKQQEGLPLAFDEMSLEALEVCFAFSEGESEAAQFGICAGVDI